MTTTLVLGDGTSVATDYAASLLRQEGSYTTINAGTAGHHLAGAILNSRTPVLLHGIEAWIAHVVPPHDPASEHGNTNVLAELSAYVDEVVVARRHVPVDVITVSQAAEFSGVTETDYRSHLSYVNSRLSASSDRVYMLLAGRILDLSSAPIIGR